MRRILAVLAVAFAGVLTVGGTVGGAPNGSDGSDGGAGGAGQGARRGQAGQPGQPGQPGSGGGEGGRDGTVGGGGNNGGGNNGGGNNGGGNDDGGGNDTPDGGGGGDDEGGEQPPPAGRSLTVDEAAELVDPHTVAVTAEFVCPTDGTYAVLARVRQGKAIGSGALPVQCERGESRTVTVETVDEKRRFEAGEADACVAVGRAGSNGIPNPECRTVTVAEAPEAPAEPS